ncbi:MAG: CusA/CzcA family heavy metal efflux RND transporter [Bacteroidota bacterium]|nr:CusA/CzcA family heavy metal efflux RND transporter [Bacteroidota bacterium]
MFDRIIKFSIGNKLIVAILTLAMAIWGGYSLTQLPIDAVPDVTNNQVQIITHAPALSAQEVERFITAPLEIAFANVPQQIEIRSISRSGLSVITVVFEDEADLYRARQLVSEQIKVAQQVIPPNIGVPELAPITTGLGEIYQYVVDVKPGYEGKYTLEDIRTVQDWIVKRKLAGTPGVTEVSSFGGKLKSYEIAVDPEKLRAMDISLIQIFKALETNNDNTGGSYIEKNHRALFIRGEGLITSLGDIKNIVIIERNGIPIYINDVAEVNFNYEVRYGAMTKNGKGEVVGGVVLMLKGANSQKVIEAVENKIAKINEILPEGLVIIPFINRSELIERAIGTVKNNLIEGGLIVIFVLVLLLGNLRAGILVASVIPLSLLFAFALMHMFGVSANLMSLGAIDFGLVVDGAVIVVEAIMHHLVINARQSGVLKIDRNEMDNTVFESASKIRQSAAFGEIIILIVYLPIWALAGIEGKMFKPMAQTVSFAILGSLILSMTYVPMAASVFLSKKIRTNPDISEKVIDKLYSWYKPVLMFCMKIKLQIVGLALLFLVFSLWLFTKLGGEFLPRLEEGNFAVETKIGTGSSLTDMVETCTKAEQILLQFPEVKQVVSRIGAPEIPTDPMPMENGDLMIILKNKSEWTSAKTMPELAEKMNDKLKAIPGLQLSFLQPIEMRTNELISGVRADVGIKIFGDDLNELLTVAQKTASLISNVEGIKDLKVEPIEEVPQILVTYNRERIARYGLNIKDLNTLLRTSFAGERAGYVFEGEKRFSLIVRLSEKSRNDITDLSGIYIDLPNGNKIPFSEVATIKYADAPMQVSRENTKRRVSITFNVRGRDVESTVIETEQLMKQKIQLPPGYFFTFGGQFENLIEAKQRLVIAVPVALALIFLLLFFTFHSAKDALLIYSSIPLSAIGGIIALWWRDMPFSISAGIGFIALFGVCVLNGIVLISYLKSLEKEGVMDINERIFEATKVRFRPVIMTAMVASLGFLPMAISHSAGAEVQKPLATVVIGGLVSATLLTLIVLPILYNLAYAKKQ